MVSALRAELLSAHFARLVILGARHFLTPTSRYSFTLLFFFIDYLMKQWTDIIAMPTYAPENIKATNYTPAWRTTSTVNFWVREATPYVAK